MVQHEFKVIRSDDKVYRIIDLTDPSIVGVTECYTDSKKDTDEALYQRSNIWAKEIVSAKVRGYRIFVTLDDDNADAPIDEDYLRGIMKEMASFFLASVINEHPIEFEAYHSPLPKTGDKTEINPSQKEKWWKHWWKAWQFYTIISVLVLIVIACVIWWEPISDALEIILCLPMLIVMFIAYADDLFARR